MTPFEKLLQKRREKKRQRKLKQQKKESDSEESDDESSDDVPSDVDMNDPYFAEEFNKPEFKKKDKKKREVDEDSDGDCNKAELELLVDEDDGKRHFSLKKIQEAETASKKSKRKKKLKEKMKEQKETGQDFEMDLNDKRFAALYESHHYNVDPSDPNFKRTKNMEKLIQEKLKRRPADQLETTEPKKSKGDIELSLLVKNIKRKTKGVLKNK